MCIRDSNNICQSATQDTNYLKATILENELNAEYEKLDLSDEQRNVIMQWLDAVSYTHLDVYKRQKPRSSSHMAIFSIFKYLFCYI